MGGPVARPRRRLATSPSPTRWPARSSTPASRTSEFIGRATSGFDDYRRTVEPYTLEYAERETGIPAAAIREAAHAYAKADRAMICWTLGITEHHNAVDNVLALISLALLTGHVGRYGSGLNPLRGQNNVQGGGDMGALPDRLPGFQHVENEALRDNCETIWQRRVPPKRGWHLSGMFEAMDRGRADLALRPRREPAPVRGRPPPHRAAPDGPRPARRPGHLPHRDRRDRRRRAAGRGRMGRERGHGHELRAARPAGAQGTRAAGRGARRPVDPVRARPAAGPRLGRGDRRERSGTRSARSRPSIAG